MATPTLGAPEWGASQASPWTQANKARRIFDAFGYRTAIEDRDLVSPPASCADGARYMVAGSGSGAWASHGGELAIAFGANASNGWVFCTIENEGMTVWVEDESTLIQYVGGMWVESSDTPVALDDLTDVETGAKLDGYTLLWSESHQLWYAGPVPSAGAEELDELDDVQISAIADGQILQWDGYINKWVNVEPSSTADVQAILNQLEPDDDLRAPSAPEANGDIPVFNGTEWVRRYTVDPGYLWGSYLHSITGLLTFDYIDINTLLDSWGGTPWPNGSTLVKKPGAWNVLNPPASDGNTYLFTVVNGVISWAQDVSGATDPYAEEPSLGELRDLAIGGAQDGNVLTYDASNGLWFPATPSSYTNEQARDAIAAALVAGPNIDIDVDDDADTITISATGAGGDSSVIINQYYDDGGEMLQKSLSNRFFKWIKAGSNTTANTMGISSVNVILSTTYTAPASTNLRTRRSRLTYQTAAGAGSQAGMTEPSNTSSTCRRNGFFAVWRWSHGLIANTGFATFTGLANTTSPGNVDPSSLTQMLGFGKDAGDSNYYFMHNDGSGSATKVDLGANFPGATNDTVYEGTIYCGEGGSTIYYSLRRFDSAQFVEGSVAADIPDIDQFLTQIIWVHNRAVAANANIELQSFYCESVSGH